MFGASKADFWKEFAKKNNGSGFDGLGSTDETSIPNKEFGANGLEICLQGIRHKVKEVRWYAAYKALDFLSEKDLEKVQKEIKPILPDKVKEVEAAKRFLFSVVTGNYDGSEFTKTKNGKWVSFILFPDPQYFCGEVWICNREQNRTFQKIEGLTSSSLVFSPSGEFLLGEIQGRKRTTFHFVELSSKKVNTFDFCDFLERDGKKFNLPVGENLGGGCFEMSLLEWNPTGDKVLISYDYICFGDGENDIEEKGWAVFSLNKMAVESIQRALANQDYKQRPGSFRW